MKTTTIFAALAVAAGSVNAAAVAEPEAQWCQLIGQSCWKVKRTAEAFAEALASSGGLPDVNNAVARRSIAPGGLADNAKRGLDDLAGIVASTQSNPRSFYESLGLTGHFAERDVDEVEKREAEASPEAEAQWCQLIGQSCWKVKRAAEAVVNTIDGFNSEAVSKRSFEPLVAGKREAEPEAQWCQLIGQSCRRSVEARCHAPGGACANARRDLHGMYHAARQVLNSLPAQ